ncbi:hypothetical protein [Hydrogenophaga sp.]|uniref:hypothetical protein n=1 Tax=Hydrogenophaga sp. TaxID=1904254 RepID=UPI0025C02AB2|nr:hypothetical protein [Hydrogenophaga sp.]
MRSAIVRNLAIGLLALLAIGGIGWAILRSVMRQIGGEPSEAMAVMQDVAPGQPSR